MDMTARIYVHPRDFFRFFPTVEAGVNAGDASTGSERLGVYVWPLGRTPFGFAFGPDFGVACIPSSCDGMPFGLCIPLICGRAGLDEGAIPTPSSPVSKTCKEIRQNTTHP